MWRPVVLTIAWLLVAHAPAMAADFTIPQDAAKIEREQREVLEWNRRTLAGAYDKIGTKDAKWDAAARQALEIAAEEFSKIAQTSILIGRVHEPARRAVEAGCDDPLILYLYARSSVGRNSPGVPEMISRYQRAAKGMEASRYAPLRRATAMHNYANFLVNRPDRTDEHRQEASRLYRASLQLIAEDAGLPPAERRPRWEDAWADSAFFVLFSQHRLTGNYPDAWERIDAVLEKIPAAKSVHRATKGRYLTLYGWEARGSGLANTVTPEGRKKFTERLAEARAAFEESWDSRTDGGAYAATHMLTALKGLSAEPEELRVWFERAMTVDGNNRPACVILMDCLDPKWGGSDEALLEFGSACRRTNNWPAAIPLLASEAHMRVARPRSTEGRQAYLADEKVWADFREPFEEYLKRYPDDFISRTRYAGLCTISRRYADADRQFQLLGDQLVSLPDMPLEWLKSSRELAARKAREVAPPINPPAEKP